MMMLKHTNITNTIFFLLCIVLTLANSHSDWDAQCGQCKCVWADGKRLADCKNIQLKSVPEMSAYIQVLDLSENDIAELKREEFEKASLQNLHKLFIRNSALQEVHKESLRGLGILIELDLSSNSITQLKPGTFSGLIKLRTVILNNNKIDRLEDRLFADLEHLHKIEFKHNQIHRVGLNVFVNLQNLQSIYLDYNRLSHLRKETFQKLDKLNGLSLTENPWNCTCDLKPFRDFAIDRNLYTQPTSCHGPKDLVGKMWNEVKSERFACKPRIFTPRPGTYVTAAKDNVTLTCKVRGSVMEISWLFNKRSINLNDKRIKIKSYAEQRQPGSRESNEVFTSDLTITNLRGSDKGNYVCKAQNPGGYDEADITFDISSDVFERGVISNSSSNVLIIAALVAIGLLILLIFVLISICCYCRRVKNYSKNNTVQENGLINTKLEKQQQSDSIIEGGSVIMEMQKSLLTEVNPVEKPPRRADIESSEHGDAEENGDVKRTLLDETILASHDDETQSLALSDTRPRSRQTFVDDGYGTNLPPDLLKFGNRFAQSPSMQSSLSNLHDGRMYGKSPLGSPVYQHAPLGYTTTMTPAGFRTLQHPKIGRTIAVATNRSNSPFTPAPLIFPQTVMKQGYVTIPRKPRTPSWAPSANSTVIDFPPTSPTSMTSSTEIADPIYDNLGMRTTASGYSTLELHKKGAVKYTMKDRPLPATPVPNGGGLTISGQGTAYDQMTGDVPSDTFMGQSTQNNLDTEPLYPKSMGGMAQIMNGSAANTEKNTLSKIPPRPPPKPKKKVSVTSTSQGLTSNQIFEDEGEDGTEV